jgi:hypothetical protein
MRIKKLKSVRVSARTKFRPPKSYARKDGVSRAMLRLQVRRLHFLLPKSPQCLRSFA